MRDLISNPKILIMLCLTLGLAPFSPEPHLWGKLKWIYGGAEGMQLMDWWDTLMHGAPFILLLVYAVMRLSGRLPQEQSFD